ncbi:MAG: polysaccharide deacetylase family protein [Theionarchaea archaeon]|nr:polysaccharide deacetylase family protein [Theionarchaea archaeon]MBU7038685.1 polysaccharide deacetylase family protein [Theionarchaea archaeon]
MFTIDVERDHSPQGKTYHGMTLLSGALDFCDDHDIVATLFCTGDVARKFPDFLREVTRKHEMGCHMDDHEPLVPTAYDNRQISRFNAEKALTAATAALRAVKNPLCFRAPYLAFDDTFIPALIQHGYSVSSSVPASHSKGLVVRGEITEVCVSTSLSTIPSLEYDVFSLENLIRKGNPLLRGLFDLLILKFRTVPLLPVVFLCHSWELTPSALCAVHTLLENFPDTMRFDTVSGFSQKLHQSFKTRS